MENSNQPSQKASKNGLARKLFGWISAGLSAFAPNTVTAYDNSKFPQFEFITPNRKFQHISIHPNDEEWLITEYEKMGQLLLYNIKTNHLKHYVMRSKHQYEFAAFSPNGEQIVMIRREIPANEMASNWLENLKASEIAIMNTDGSALKVLPIPRGVITSAAVSPDGKKIAYWIAKTIRAQGSKTPVADFDIREFDLSTGKDQLFAGPFNFFSARNIIYQSDSTLLIGASSPRMEPGEIWDFEKRHNRSEIYQLNRGQTGIPIPVFSDHNNANRPATDKKNNTYFVDFPEDIGQAITRVAYDNTSTSWRAPDWNGDRIFQIAASRNGKYLAFIYGSSSWKTADKGKALGIFHIDKETWLPIQLPPNRSAQIIHVTP